VLSIGGFFGISSDIARLVRQESLAMTGEGGDVRAEVDAVYRSDSRRVLATLVRLLGDLDLAEEALHEAFAAAMKAWPSGVPANPRAWLVSTGRFKAIDALRRRSRRDTAVFELARESVVAGDAVPSEAAPSGLEDDRLRLIFLCCHPVNSVEAQVALTLREVCDLTTEQIAAAYLVEVPTLAKRIVRAKSRLREERIAYDVPTAELPGRLGVVLQVVYLMFNEGYSASSGESLVRGELSSEAIRLGQLLNELVEAGEVRGLLALMLLQESRKGARLSADGEILLLDEQDRALWDRAAIEEGLALVDRALALGPPGTYALQAAIAALHARADRFQDTDWPQIVALYDLLLTVDPSPVVALNRAVAVAMRDGPSAGLALVEGILAEGGLTDYHLAHAVRADLHRRLGHTAEARLSYEKALYWARQGPERRFLHSRLKTLPGY
jgi:RNA polymerase sigma-70 factor (ECF subfamily)